MEMYHMVDQLKYFLKALESDDEFFKTTASITKKHLDAYMEHGFTREEALTLICKLGNGTSPGQR